MVGYGSPFVATVTAKRDIWAGASMGIRVVEDDMMPAGHLWVSLRYDDGEETLVVAASVVSPEVRSRLSASS